MIFKALFELNDLPSEAINYTLWRIKYAASRNGYDAKIVLNYLPNSDEIINGSIEISPLFSAEEINKLTDKVNDNLNGNGDIYFKMRKMEPEYCSPPSSKN